MARHRVLSHEDKVEYGHGSEEIYPPAPAISPPFTPWSPPPPPPHLDAEQNHSRRLNNLFLIAAAVIAATVLLSLTYYAVLRRRHRGPLRDAAIVAPGGGSDGGGASFGDEEPFHHVWYIRTVGLDESTIASIAVAEYRAGDGLLDGVSSCSVCLGEFGDGESVRLLPKCGHAFHVACIDTWLRAHVNCPLCRAHIVEPDGTPATYATPAVTASAGSFDSDSASAAQTEVLQIGIQTLEEQERALESTFDVGIPSYTPQALDSLPESSSSRGQSDLAYGLQPVRRSFSMDAPLMNSVIVRVDTEQRITGREEKAAFFEEECATKGNSSKGAVDEKSHSEMERSFSSSGRGFFFSRPGRVARIHSLPM